MSSMYLRHIDGFRDVDPSAISSKYSMYMLTNNGDIGEPKALPFSYIRSHLEVGCLHTDSQYLN